ncbi:MAG: hypothetical protein PHI49_09810 [Halothiobacillaceae bacterium]|nr:hypothetical protein [Halothiobacillaceae bacterium]
MNLQTLLDDYTRLTQQVQPRHDTLPTLQQTAFQVETRIENSLDALQNLLDAFGAQTGWVQYTGAQGLIDTLGIAARHADAGPLLNAELAKAGHSLRITHLGHAWQGVLTRRGEGTPCLMDRVKSPVHGLPTHLDHERYWQIDAQGECRPVHAALVTVE